MTDLEAFIEYNRKDVEMCQRWHEMIAARYRLEYLPRYGSAWENMMLLDMSTPHYKE
jgi:hypothetical protein